MNGSALEKEWQLLQEQFDSYEKHSLLIKLISIVLTTITILITTNTLQNILMVTVLVVLWLQDAIWKTFQSRIETRLLNIEAALLLESNTSKKPEQSKVHAYQFNQEFINNRAGGLGTLVEYLKNSIRPTIAFPHVITIAITAIPLFLLL